MHLAGLALEEAHELDDLDAFEPAVEQLAHREFAAPVVHRDHDLVDAELLGERAQLTDAVRQHFVLVDQHLLAGRGHVTDDDEAALIGAAAQLAQAAARAGRRRTRARGA